MAADNRSSSSHPFGYTFPTYPTSNNPPAGPPLLDQDESSTLQSFFNDPDHFGNTDGLADAALTTLAAASDLRLSLFDGDNQWMYAQDQPFPAPFPDQEHAFVPPHPPPFAQQQQQQQRHTPIAGGPEDVLNLVGIPTNGTPDDVLHAASTLFMYRANQIPDPNSLAGLSNIFAAPGRPETRQPQNARHASYPFNVPAAPNVQQPSHHYAPSMNGHFRSSFDASNTHSQPAAPNHTQARPPMYHFGSDNNFRHNGYDAPFENLDEATTQPHIDFVRGMVNHPNGGASSVENSVPPTPELTRRDHKFPPVALHSFATDSVEQRPPPGPARPKPKKRRKTRPSGGISDDYEAEQKPRPTSPAFDRASSREETAVTEASPEEDDDDDDDDGDDGSPPPNSVKRRRASSGTHGKSGSLSRKNLTEEQKRSNHIRSEQKRRNIIKQGYQDLNELVPNLKTGGFSKSAVLTETTRFLEELKAGNDRMETYLQQLGARNGAAFE